MKKYLVFTCTLLLEFGLFAQQKDATYLNGSDSLAFSNGKAIFSITGFAGLSTAQVGEGSYEELNHYLLVNTTEYSGEKSTYQATESSLKDSCKVKVVATNNYALPKILIEALTQSDKLIASKITGDDGEVMFPHNPKIGKIKISALGYDPLTIPYTAGLEYLVKMSKNNIIEQSTVVFYIETVDEETISLLLLTDDFRAGKNKLVELQKLEKKVRKRNLLEKRMKKVYVPYIRKM
jgi:hypothetical protein